MDMKYLRPLTIVPAAIFLVLCTMPGCGNGGAALPAVNPSAPTIRLASPAFTDGAMIPREFTCDGADRSPPLQWSGVPQEARSLVMIGDDPDAPGGTWSHWVLYDLSPSITSLDAGVAADLMATPDPQTANKQPGLTATQGKNDFGKVGYGGPCPPWGAHRYYFRLYALDQPTRLAPGATRTAVLKAIAGHILAEGHLMGKYSR
jgi:Raf kinase inhibitor-like YbhB/YbcL family protein